MKLNLGCGTFKMGGFDNLDRSEGWILQYGLPYPNDSVEAITISHLLYAIPEVDYPPFFHEIYRVLIPNGVVRITCINSESISSKWCIASNPWRWATSFTGPALIRRHMEYAGLRPVDVTATTTIFRDKSLLQSHHGEEPDVFYIEGQK